MNQAAALPDLEKICAQLVFVVAPVSGSQWSVSREGSEDCELFSRRADALQYAYFSASRERPSFVTAVRSDASVESAWFFAAQRGIHRVTFNRTVCSQAQPR